MAHFHLKFFGIGVEDITAVFDKNEIIELIDSYNSGEDITDQIERFDCAELHTHKSGPDYENCELICVNKDTGEETTIDLDDCDVIDIDEWKERNGLEYAYGSMKIPACKFAAEITLVSKGEFLGYDIETDEIDPSKIVIVTDGTDCETDIISHMEYMENGRQISQDNNMSTSRGKDTQFTIWDSEWNIIDIDNFQ